jgi:hypothetical protein
MLASGTGVRYDAIDRMVTFRLLLVVATALMCGAEAAAPKKTNAPPVIVTKAPRYLPKPPKKEVKKAEAKKPEKYDDEKPFEDVVKNMEVMKGMFTFYRKPEDNKYYLEIATNQFEKLFLFSSSVDQSVGERGLWSAQMAGEFPFVFRLVGRNVQMLIKNAVYTATNNTPESRTTDRSFPDSLMGAARILSRPHPERKSFLINLSDIYLNDLPGFARTLKNAYAPTDYRFDKGNSSFGAVKSFPENILIEADLHFSTDNPRVGTVTLPDARSIPIVMKYDITAIKDTGYKPRAADDRVGHFLTVQADYSSDRAKSLMVRRINRWNLQKSDPTAALSPPKKPIVFWLENTIPVEYRAAITEGVLMWNKAFERIGFKDALVVKQQPDKTDWDPADSRYNTIRWFAGIDLALAIGPSRANPYTGEIYDADISMSEGFMRSIRRQGEEFLGPVTTPSIAAEPIAPPLAWTRESERFCNHAEGMAQQAQFGAAVLQARGALTKQMEDKLVHEYLVETIAHEVGHTLGLRHNFRASSLLKPEELFDDAKTEQMGQSGSVMDYNAMVIASKDQKQGHFIPVTLGPYDYWAIEYAYKPIEGDETAELAKIASRAAEAGLGYSTDEDALGTYAAGAMDPMVNQFDQSSDPLGFFANRVEIIRELWSNMETKLLEKGEGFQVLRRAMGRAMGEYYRAIVTSSKFVGGVYHYRDHFGDPNGRAPFTPVPANKQREALAFLQKYAFAEDAFELPPTLLNRLAAERLPGVTGIGGLYNAEGRTDYAWHDAVLNLHRAVLGRLFQPVTLGRMQDNELRFGPDEKVFTMADIFEGLDASIWSELDGGAGKITAVRRNLQREHLKQLVRLTVRNVAGVPEDATSLARASLSSLRAKIENSLKAGKITDVTSRAHLQESGERIKATLEAQVWRTAE